MSLEIDSVDPAGTGHAAGLRVGDRVVAVNDRMVRDPLEWRYLIADEVVSVAVERGGEAVVVQVEKDHDDTLGVHLTGPGFRKCNNKCIFCFIDQNPRGVRKPLRFKDEDFRLSFLYGNYVTLTNTPREDLDRIIEQRLSPIYISVHATQPELRRALLGNGRAPDVLPIMRYLAEGKIEMHTQVVLMPGLNDGAHLERTVNDLAALYPWVRSVCIVPVGLTKFRERLPALRAFEAGEADDLIRWLRGIHRRFTGERGARFVHLSDEFYLLAGRPIPSMKFYEDFPQVGNGVGMVRQFLDEYRGSFPRLLRQFTSKPTKLGVDLVTAVLPARFLLDMAGEVNRSVANLEIIPHVVVNGRYGERITVSGLLCGCDIENTLKRDGVRGDVVLLPPNVLNEDLLFLDDVHFEEFQARLGVPVVVGTYSLCESLMMAWGPTRERRAGTGTGLPVLSEARPAETMTAH